MKTVIVTKPELLYERVAVRIDGSLPIQSRATAGLVALSSELGIADTENFSILNEALGSLSDIRIERDTLDVEAIGVQILGLIRQHPFLRRMPIFSGNRRSTFDREAISAKQFDAWIGNHLFDDYPNMFGITEGEAHDLRGYVNSRVSDDMVRPLFHKLDLLWDLGI